MFVAAGDQGIEQRGSFGFKRDVADFVADQQRDAAKLVQFGVEPPGALRGVQLLDPLVRGGERDAVAAPGGWDRKGDAQVGSCRCRRLSMVLPRSLRVLAG